MTQKREQYVTMAKRLNKGVPPKQVLLEAGYSAHTAEKGMAAMPKKVMNIMSVRGRRLQKLGASVNPTEQINLVRGRLMENVIKGTDKGAQSAKILGSESRVNMWQQEYQNGIVIINMPAGIDSRALLDAPEEV